MVLTYKAKLITKLVFCLSDQNKTTTKLVLKPPAKMIFFGKVNFGQVLYSKYYWSMVMMQ